VTSDEKVIRDLLSDSAPTFGSLDGSAVRERSAALQPRRDSRWPRAVPATAAAVLIAGIALGASLLFRGTPTHSTGSGGNTEAHTFRLQLVLPATSAQADGTPIRAFVVAINHTGKPIEIRDASCDAWIQAGLSGRHIQFEVSSSDVGCASGQLREGITRLRVKILTTYNGCQQGSQPGTADMPHCQGPHDTGIPPLPPGEYQVHLGTQNVSPTPAMPRPAHITLTPVAH
jgi:hypothetical protein